MKISTPLLLLTAVYWVSCSKNGSTSTPDPGPGNGKSHATEILSYSIEGMDAQTTISAGDKMIAVRLPDSLTHPEDIVAKFTISPGATITVNSTAQVSGTSKNNYENEIDYKVTAEDGTTYSYWRIVAANTDYSINWGLGHVVKKFVHNDRAYYWYIDQTNTGAYSSINCGPSATTMAIKWYDSTFSHTAEDARNFSQTTGDLWYPATINNYLSYYDIPKTFVNLDNDMTKDRQLITAELDKGNILIAMLQTNTIRPAGSGEQRIDRYYDWGAGHCIVIKGYMLVDNECFYQVYDPWSYGASYNNGTLKGVDRFYRADDVANGCLLNDNTLWSIAPKK